MYEQNGMHYLEVREQIPAGKQNWQPVAAGNWMPFDGGRHNGGKWLHTPEEWAARKAVGGGADQACRRF